MQNEFKREHFDLLQRWRGIPRDHEDPSNNYAYEVLSQAYEATAKWAEQLQKTTFHSGKWEIRRRPTSQGNIFKPYTWARIYPTAGSPKKLAYTVGIDAVGEFCVKIDTVDADESLRSAYEAIRGPAYRGSAIASVISPEDGLAMTGDQLVDWSAQAIGQFGIGYGTLATRLELTSPILRLVKDLAISHASFGQWRDSLLEGAVKHNGIWWLQDSGLFFALSGGSTFDMELGFDPRGKSWGVQINEPPSPGDANRLSSIATDQTGARFLLRQGWLRPNARRAHDVKGKDFIDVTGLQPAKVSRDDAGGREWFIVAALDEPSSAIRRSTTRFVERCWAIYLPLASPNTPKPLAPIFEIGNLSENGNSYSMPARPAVDDRLIIKGHGKVWLALTSLLSASGVNYWKGQINIGFEIDLEIPDTGGLPLLIEIKTDTSASTIYTGLGQLELYRQLFPRLADHMPVLLLPPGIRDELKAAVEKCGVKVHSYTCDIGTFDDVRFTAEFLQQCGLPTRLPIIKPA